VNPSRPGNGRDPSKPRCAARRSTDGQPCGNPPAPGCSTCRYHGAKARQVRRKAAERVAEAAVRAALAPYAADCEPVSDPLSALLKVAGEILQFKAYVGGRVAELGAADWRYNTKVAEQVRGEIQLYERALDRAARVLGEIARLNLEERLVRLSERQGSLIAVAFEQLLDGLGLPAEEHQRALRLLPPILRDVGKEA
jgi:hypothetical protein